VPGDFLGNFAFGGGIARRNALDAPGDFSYSSAPFTVAPRHGRQF
jgi:hypothetical protein